MHQIGYKTYHCSVSQKAILKDLDSFAYDPHETDGYHGRLTFHKEPVYKNIDEAKAAIEKYDRGWYDDHAVFFKEGRKKYYLVKYEFHC